MDTKSDDGKNDDDNDGSSSEGVSDDIDENMSESEDMSDQDVDLLREWSKKKFRLEVIEQQKASDASKDENRAVEIEHSEKQIFDTKAAFRRLLNELEEIIKAQDMNLMVDAPGPEGLFQWKSI